MKGSDLNFVLNATGATAITTRQTLQELWSGYGTIERLTLAGARIESVVLKHVQLPTQQQHPRGWNTSLSHARKVQSYRVEAHWYRHYSHRSSARLPHCLAIEQQGDNVLMLLEDLDAASYRLRKTRVDWAELVACLTWLAQFHASYLGQAPEGLWDIGTYWHLATRPQELAALDDEQLRTAAPLIATKLDGCTYQTLVHGDAKLANFCFAPEGAVAGLDFQYVGGGCGMRDVAYFVGSCLDEHECERRESQILDTYFAALHHALGAVHAPLEEEWRPLYRVAWADFHRFLKGWSPGHWNLTSYSERVTTEVLHAL